MLRPATSPLQTADIRSIPKARANGPFFLTAAPFFERPSCSRTPHIIQAPSEPAIPPLHRLSTTFHSDLHICWIPSIAHAHAGFRLQDGIEPVAIVAHSTSDTLVELLWVKISDATDPLATEPHKRGSQNGHHSGCGARRRAKNVGITP